MLFEEDVFVDYKDNDKLRPFPIPIASVLDEIERTLLFFSLSKITVPRAKWVRITQKYKELGGKC